MANEPEKYCKFCFGTEQDSSLTFVHPCRCRGSIHWVHHRCLFLWFSKANAVQQTMCTQCQTRYQKQLILQPVRSWRLPRIRVDRYMFFEMICDVWVTYRTVTGFVGMMNGTCGILHELGWCTLWKMIVGSSRRFCFYGNLAMRIAESMFRITVADYDERRDITARLPSDMNWDKISSSAVPN